LGATAQRLEPGAQAEAYSALVSLGYRPVEATRLLKALGNESSALPTEELIRRALQSAVRE
jgi:Holliday junction DNA helicase RuvA